MQLSQTSNITKQFICSLLFWGALHIANAHFFDENSNTESTEYRYHSIDSMIEEQNLKSWHPPFDPETITFLHDGFAFDKNYIYIEAFTRLPYKTDADLKKYETLFLERIINFTQIDRTLIDFDSLTNLAGIGYFFRDKDNIYSFDQVLPVENPNQFQVLNENFARDNKHIYYHKDPFEIADYETFKVIDAVYSHDKNHLYQGYKPIEAIKTQNPLSFRRINSKYYADDTAVYYKFFWDGLSVIENADPKTFELLNDRYARDHQNVYIFDQILPAINRDSLEVLERNFARDNRHLYYNGKPIPNANRLSYRSLQYHYPEENRRQFSADGQVATEYGNTHFYSTDNRYGYYSSETLGTESISDSTLTIMDKDVDTWSLKELNQEFAIDRDTIYYRGKTLQSPQFHYHSFESLGPLSHIFRDQNNVYRYHNGEIKIIENADPKTIQYYDSSLYLRDKDYVYYIDQPLEKADAETFQYNPRNSHLARDQYHCYDKAEIVDCP